jgi:hypothetical protein
MTPDKLLLLSVYFHIWWIHEWFNERYDEYIKEHE